jgi:hypothetical protein
MALEEAAGPSCTRDEAADLVHARLAGDVGGRNHELVYRVAVRGVVGLDEVMQNDCFNFWGEGSWTTRALRSQSLEVETAAQRRTTHAEMRCGLFYGPLLLLNSRVGGRHAVGGDLRGP